MHPDVLDLLGLHWKPWVTLAQKLHDVITESYVILWERKSSWWMKSSLSCPAVPKLAVRRTAGVSFPFRFKLTGKEQMSSGDKGFILQGSSLILWWLSSHCNSSWGHFYARVKIPLFSCFCCVQNTSRRG